MFSIFEIIQRIMLFLNSYRLTYLLSFRDRNRKDMDSIIIQIPHLLSPGSHPVMADATPAERRLCQEWRLKYYLSEFVSVYLGRWIPRK